MIRVASISKNFAAPAKGAAIAAVSSVDLNLEKGEFLAVMGRSGSGKSTLMAMLGGISRPTSGSALIDGIDQWCLTDDAHADFRNRNIGFVFQFASLLPALRAIDNVALPAVLGGSLSKSEAYARARALLERVGLGERCDSFPGQLSGGEQRRVAIARALVNAPQLLLADEPTADLDEETEAEILNLLIDIQRAYGLTLMVITHNLEVAQRADRVVYMRAGKIAEERSGGYCEPDRFNAAAAAENGRVGEIFEISSSSAASEPVRLGEGIERFLGQLVLYTVPIVGLIWLLNYAVCSYQNSLLEAKAAARVALEELAMKDLRAEVKDITLASGKSYQLTLYLRNTTQERPIYVMRPNVRAFVQVGSSWQEVPLIPLTKQPGASQVLKITDKQFCTYLLKPDVPDFAQLLPYYMHVRISNDMLVSPSSQPKDDLIERNDNYYVYLKPHDADDAAILQKLKFPEKPPIWIAMPPH
jgi:ABC-type lipoprotein export system ATPase subunit